MKERLINKFFIVLTLLMSATLLYGGYQVRLEAGKKSDYEEAARQKAVVVNMSLCEELQPGSFQKAAKIENPLQFLRVCAGSVR